MPTNRLRVDDEVRQPGVLDNTKILHGRNMRPDEDKGGDLRLPEGPQHAGSAELFRHTTTVGHSRARAANAQ